MSLNFIALSWHGHCNRVDGNSRFWVCE